MSNIEKISGYKLSRDWFDFCMDNPEMIKPNHTALYFFAIEHCNRLGWKEKFGFPTTLVMEVIGMKSYKTYIKTLTDLVDWGFIRMIEKSKNQYKANIVALVKNDKALTKALTEAATKALDKALLNHGTKQVQSIVSVDKQLNQEQLKQINNIIKEEILNSNEWITSQCRVHNFDLKKFHEKFEIFWDENYEGHKLEASPKQQNDIKHHFKNTMKSEKNGRFKKTSGFTNKKQDNAERKDFNID